MVSQIIPEISFPAVLSPEWWAASAQLRRDLDRLEAKNNELCAYVASLPEPEPGDPIWDWQNGEFVQVGTVPEPVDWRNAEPIGEEYVMGVGYVPIYSEEVVEAYGLEYGD